MLAFQKQKTPEITLGDARTAGFVIKAHVLYCKAQGEKYNIK